MGLKVTCGALPVVGARLLSAYGVRRGGPHYGIDLAAPEGASVYAVRPGVVRFVARNGELERYGNTVVLDHGPWLTLSAHLRSVSVTQGEHVEQGARIGTLGRTAGTRALPDAVFVKDPPHLHLEFLSAWPVVQGGAARLDPAPMLGELGIVVPEQGPIFSACGSDERIARAGGGGLLLVAALYFAHRAGLI